MNSPSSAEKPHGIPALDLPDTVGPHAVKRLRLLSLTGGGYRGLFSISTLHYLALEFKPEKDIGQCFDVFAGTSIGGLMACALAVGIPVQRVMDAILKHGDKIFEKPKASGLKRLFSGPIYRSETLKEAIKDCLQEHAQTRLCDVERHVIIPSVNWARGEVQIFMSKPFGSNHASKETLLDVCMATSAAPTYFPTHGIDGETMIDGGLVANNPDVIALMECARVEPQAIDRLEILSIGTAGAPKERIADKPPGSKVEWAPKIADLIIDCQEQLASSQCKRLLQQRYIRLNYEPISGEKNFGQLDQVDLNTTLALLSAGKRCALAAKQSKESNILISRLLSARN
jgi:hypothetical protein